MKSQRWTISVVFGLGSDGSSFFALTVTTVVSSGEMSADWVFSGNARSLTAFVKDRRLWRQLRKAAELPFLFLWHL
jgi:hypothetical protein